MNGRKLAGNLYFVCFHCFNKKANVPRPFSVNHNMRLVKTVVELFKDVVRPDYGAIHTHLMRGCAMHARHNVAQGHGEVDKLLKSGFFLGCEPLPELLPLFFYFYFPFSDQDAAGERSVIAGVQMYGVILANELPPFAAADQSSGAGRVTESGLFESLVKAMECKHKDVCSLLSVRCDCKEYRKSQI
jgi:hypothetical protein